MKTLEEALTLAHLMVEIGHLAGRQVAAMISDMNQPLGYAVGNALEVREAIETLHGGGPADFREHCLAASAYLVKMGGLAQSESEARVMVESALDSGNAWRRFHTMVAAQGGDVRYIEDPTLLPSASLVEVVTAPSSAYLITLHAQPVGEAVVLLGGGRSRKGDAIDHAVGVVVHHKVGDRVEKGQPVCTIYANDPARLLEARAKIDEAITFSRVAVPPLPLFYDWIG
jgi:pyrimidine-nucleoside phosphorylase